MISLSFPPFIPIFTVTPNLFTPLWLQHFSHRRSCHDIFSSPLLSPPLCATFIRYDYIYKERRKGEGGREGGKRKKLATQQTRSTNFVTCSRYGNISTCVGNLDLETIRPHSFLLFFPFSVLNRARTLLPSTLSLANYFHA